MDDARLACRLCDDAFLRPEHLALHLGRRHGDALTDDERTTFTAAVGAEEAWLVQLKRRIDAAWFVLPIFLFYIFSVILVFQMDGNPAWAILITPGYAAFGALVYGMAYTRIQLKETGQLGPGGRGA